MLKKLLIANRGEIALRINRTARRLGVRTIAVYSDADRGSLHVKEADESVPIGPSPATESYLRMDRIIAAAKSCGADAIHPGYGFLSENADFPDACRKAGIAFVGPTSEAMRKLGGKAAAKAVAREAGVPVVPGYDGEAQDARTLGREAERIGFPVMIKAVAGGGGRGMRLVGKPEELAGLLESAKREAKSSFGDDRVLIEKVVVAPRHVEVQVFGDRHGNVVHMFERDCTLQRRNQKVIEEAPAPGMSAALREKICGAAVKIAKAARYEGAGTVEFLVEGGALSPEAPWYFIEMNTRLQVEHPVTEEITGLDLVEWQLRVASGEPLPLKQGAIKMQGHAIEARLCAEDPAKGFLPSVGDIVHFRAAPRHGLRLETALEGTGRVTPFYDSMVAKLISSGSSREEAAGLLVDGLRSLSLYGVKTNLAFLARLLEDDDVRAARMDTGLIARRLTALTKVDKGAVDGALAAGIARLLDVKRGPRSDGPWEAADGFSLGGAREQTVTVTVDGRARAVKVAWVGEGRVSIDGGAPVPLDGDDRARDIGARVYAVANDVPYAIAWPVVDLDAAEDSGDGTELKAPINGRVAKLFVAAGAKVAKGDRIAVVEAMKMEHVLSAARAGTVAALAAKEGDQVVQGALLVRLAKEGS